MALWRRGRSEDGAAREAREKETAESIARLEAGGIPTRATRRLQEHAARGGFFTSDLSANEHLLSRAAGFEPLGQVMGSAFYGVSLRGTLNRTRYSTGELSQFTEAQLSARTLAVARLREEAALLGADGVVGVRLKRNHREWSGRTVEFTAIGTAVRLGPGLRGRTEEPFTSSLSGQDCWKLHEAGYLPREIAYGVCSYYIHSDQQARAIARSTSAAMANQEMVAYTAGVQTARDLAMTRFAGEVRRVSASGAVGVEVDWDCEEIEYEVNDVEYVDLLVHFTAVGTAIVPRPDERSGLKGTLAFYDLRGGNRGSGSLGARNLRSMAGDNNASIQFTEGD